MKVILRLPVGWQKIDASASTKDVKAYAPDAGFMAAFENAIDATKKYVDEQISSFGQVTNTKINENTDAIETNQKEISDLSAKQAALEKDVAALSATAKDALKRAEEAGVLAQGKFLFEVTMTDNDVQFGFDKYALSDEAKAQPG